MVLPIDDRLTAANTGVAAASGRCRLNAIGLAEGNIGTGHRINAYQSHITEGIVNAVRALRQDLIHFYGHRSDRIETSIPAFKRACDGLLHFVSELSDETYAAVRAAGIPLVAIGGSRAGGELACVDIDNVQAACDATRHLIDLGHRRIACLNGCDPVATANREAGYRRALEQAGIAVDDSLIVAGGSSYLSGTERTQYLMSLPALQRPTALVCFNDVVALGALRAASELRIPAPDELSVVGFDDIVEAAMFRPALTTVRQPLRLIGETAVELLLDIVEGRKAPYHHEVVPHELVIRGSTASPRRRS